MTKLFPDGIMADTWALRPKGLSDLYSFMYPYILVDGFPRQVSQAQFCVWREQNPSGHIIQQSIVNNFTVSTVFIFFDHGLSHPRPILFETMVFKTNTWDEQYQQRYYTFEDAKNGHREISQCISDNREWKTSYGVFND